MDISEILIWAGAALTIAGLTALIWCIVTVIRARRKGLADDAMRKKLRGVLAVNMAALMVSIFGLMAVILGIILR